MKFLVHVLLILTAFTGAVTSAETVLAPAGSLAECNARMGGIDVTSIIREGGRPRVVRYRRPEWDRSATYLITNRGFERLTGNGLPADLIDFAWLKDKRVLDVGCGGGKFVMELRRRGVDAIGADLVLNAKQRKMSYFHQADALHLPFADASFDVLYSSYSVLFYEKGPKILDALLTEFLRLLPTGGSLRALEFDDALVPILRQRTDIQIVRLNTEPDHRYFEAIKK